MTAFLRKHLDDILILGGCGLVVYATWLLSWIAAIYVAGVILIVLGVLVGMWNGTSPQPSPTPLREAEAAGKGKREGNQ